MRVLTGSDQTPAQALAALAEYAAALPADAPEASWDLYGDGGPVGVLERRTADLLSHEAAAYFPSGIMAQQAALRVWADTRRCRRVALPDLSHLLTHEEDGPRLLQHLEFVPLTTGPVAPSADDLTRLTGEVAAVLVELPLRDGAYAQSDWATLEGLSVAARVREMPLHLDGARLWEAATGLGRTPAEVAALFDTVYVSFYKGLGALSGACLAGPEDVIAQAKLWRRRLGGTVYTTYPHALSALRALDEVLPRMGAFHDYAVRWAKALRERGARTSPEVPGGVAFRVYLEADAAALAAAAEQRLAEGVKLPARWRPADVPGWAWTELTVSAVTLDWDVTEAANAVVALASGAKPDAASA